MILATMTPADGPVSMTIPFSPQSARRVREALVGWLARRGSAPHVVDDAQLIASELVGNSLRHASPLDDDTVLVRWQDEGTALLLSVSDGGSSSLAHQVEASPYDAGGRGLGIVSALSSTWWVERDEQQHTVHVRLSLD